MQDLMGFLCDGIVTCVFVHLLTAGMEKRFWATVQYSNLPSR